MRNMQEINDGMKWLRIKEHPFDVSEGNLVVDDKLETEGKLRLYENVGGSIFLFLEPSVMDNLALVAEVVVEEIGEKKLWIKRISYEYGYDELWYPLMQQVQHFAEFYGCALAALDLRKKR